MYQVIARRWRPKTFSEVVGQRHVVETLKRAIEKGKVVHSYLFAGPRGVGKTSMARIFAKALNCERGPTPEPCCECEACLSIDRGTFVDVVEMDAASNRGIDEIRELRERVRYASVKGRYKVYIIDEVHMLTEQAFNALLKTLEEPPAGVVFIFATTEPRKIPQTILSRCVRFDFKPLTQQEAVEILSRICEKEGVSYQREALEVIAKASGGSLRDAEMLLEQTILFTDGNVTRDRVYEVLGLVDELVAEEFINAVLSRRVDEALGIFRNDVIGRGYDVGGFITTLLERLRGLLKEAAVSGALEDAVRYYTLTRAFLRLAEEVRRHPFAELLAEAEIIRLSALPPLEHIASLLNAAETAPAIQPEKTVSSEPAPSMDGDFVESIARERPFLGQLLREAEVERDGGLVIVRPGRLKAALWEKLKEEEDYIKGKLSSLGLSLRMEGKPEDNGTLSRQDLREKARKNPAVQKVLSLFPDAVIVDVKRRN